ncbi:MAG: hypothetical protein IPG44_09380 [Anaerolineales bacterium]|jgi:hypothetical protein|nr:hypothetical protein [Chloroflexota bacterium]MBK6645951.1 hypothetical protein [Anaerolineales bacterium]MCC6986915.1 hypothetical protein [Anaerolineales bacterium]
MSAYRNNPLGDGMKRLWNNLIHNRQFNRGAAWGMMILGALLAFEVFNFSTTQYALHDMLGDLAFAGMKWSTILAIAFCGIDFAGIARIFTPEQGRDEPAEVWYLFGAWILAAGFNATLTWWGVSVAIANNGNIQGTAAMSSEFITKAVPVFVAFMVWVVRLLIIGTFSLAGERLFTTAQTNDYRSSYNQPRPQPQQQPRPVYQSQAPRPTQYNQPVNQPVLRPASQINRPINAAPSQNTFRPAPKPVSSTQSSFIPPEPTYHPVSFEARSPEGSERRYDA